MSRLFAQPTRSPSGTGRASLQKRATYRAPPPNWWTHRTSTHPYSLGNLALK